MYDIYFCFVNFDLNYALLNGIKKLKLSANRPNPLVCVEIIGSKTKTQLLY